MKIPVHIAEKIWQLLQGGSIPSSLAKHSVIEDLVSEGIIERRGRIQKTLLLSDKNALLTYLQNNCSINDLQLYIQISKQESVLRSELVSVSADSKLRKVRTFKGFLVNCYTPIQATLSGEKITLHPMEGTFQFIYDFEKFLLPPDITIVGVENPENFRHIHKQKYLFSNIKPLFVSRYPQNQSKDLIKWLQSNQNNYLHFGDFDFAGIGIYLDEFKKYLAGKATLFVPENINELLKLYGNRKRYDEQKMNASLSGNKDEKISMLLEQMHKYRKGLDQEIFMHNLSL